VGFSDPGEDRGAFRNLDDEARGVAHFLVHCGRKKNGFSLVGRRHEKGRPGGGKCKKESRADNEEFVPGKDDEQVEKSIFIFIPAGIRGLAG
jgi:hypothetical protein